MSQPSKNLLTLGFVLGLLGTIAGISLLFMGNWILGTSGTVASAGLAYNSYQNSKKQDK
ncbi:MAG: hypothetical protein AAGI23_00065 [Bacteroidota bacterium]